MQLLIPLIATVVLVTKVTSTLIYQSNPKPTHTYANNVARIDYGDPSRFDREMQRYEPGKFPQEKTSG